MTACLPASDLRSESDVALLDFGRPGPGKELG